jgi:hypothetical protein
MPLESKLPPALGVTYFTYTYKEKSHKNLLWNNNAQSIVLLLVEPPYVFLQKLNKSCPVDYN